VRARIGEPTSVPDPAQTLADVQAVLEAIVHEDRGETSAAQAAPRALVVRPPRDGDQFERALAAGRTGEIDDLGGIARNLARCPPEVWPEVQAALLDDAEGSKTQISRVLDVIGGDVPNRYGHFARHWKRDHGYQVKLSEDWFEDLLALPLGKVAHATRSIYRDLVLTVALMHATAGIARDAGDAVVTAAAVDTLLDLAYAKDGVYRDEVGRAIVSIGTPALPRLIRRSKLPTHSSRRQDDVAVKQAKFAAFNLDVMDRMQPARAIEAARGRPDLLADILAAYGDAKLGEASTYLLEHFDAPSPRVRQAARDAFLSFVTGPPPKVHATTVRTLGGGTTRRAGHLTYRGLATLAIRERLEATAPALLEREPPCEVRREDGRYDQACIEQPLRLTRAYIDELEAGRRRREAAALTRAFDLEADDPDAAMEAVNTVLATGVGDRYADRLVPFLERAVARREASSDHRRAAQALRKLATLTALGDPDAAQRLRARAFVHEASVPGLSSQGRQMLLSSAASLAPTDPRIAAASMGERAGLLTSAAQADPARLEARATARRQLGRGLALLLLGFGGLLAVVGAARRRRSSLAES